METPEALTGFFLWLQLSCSVRFSRAVPSSCPAICSKEADVEAVVPTGGSHGSKMAARGGDWSAVLSLTWDVIAIGCGEALKLARDGEWMQSASRGSLALQQSPSSQIRRL